MGGLATAAALPPTLFSDRVGLLGTEEAFRLGALIAGIEAEPPARPGPGGRVIRLNLGQPDFPLPRHVARAVDAALEQGLTTYCDPQGLPDLRRAIADSVGPPRGIEIDPARVVVYPGARCPIGFAQMVYLRPGDDVVYPTPCYPLFESFIRYQGAVPVPVPLREETGFTLTGADLEPYLTARTKLVYLNFPSNPTGGVASTSDLAEIASVIARRARPDVRVYSDESYEAIVFDDVPHASILSVPGMSERTIFTSGVSKTYAWTGGRVGWSVYPTVEEALLHRNLNINYFASLPPYNQMGAVEALRSPESSPVVRAMVNAFQRRRDLTVAGLRAIDGVSCQVPKGAFYVFPNVSGVLDRLGAVEAHEGLPDWLRTRTSPATLLQLFLLYHYRVATMDRRSFGLLGSEGQHFLRVSIAAADADLEEALDRMERASYDVEGFDSFLGSGRSLTL